MIEIKAIGGYDEVGRNMTAVRVNDDVFLFDMGIHLEPYTKLTDDSDVMKIGVKLLDKVGAIPHTSHLKEWKHLVRAIIPTHAHLDHVGAIPFLAQYYDAPVICTPFTAAVLKIVLKDEKITLRNRTHVLSPNNKIHLTDDVVLEFIHMTHSTPQTVMAALHTPEGTVLYANDFKFDHYPVLGRKPNFARLEKLGKEQKVVALIADSTYSTEEQKTPSESVARQMVKDIFLGQHAEAEAIIFTTFSSHLARLKSVIDFGKKTNRKILFLGRSLCKYVQAGEMVNLVNFSQDVTLVKYRKNILQQLKKVMKEGKEKYLLVVTGHQGEPNALLSRMARGETPFVFGSKDRVIFSCRTIPTATNKANRKQLERLLKQSGVHLFKDVHVSGHAAKEDLQDLLDIVKPKHVIPAHGIDSMKNGLASLAREIGYTKDAIHILHNGKQLKIGSSH